MLAFCSTVRRLPLIVLFWQDRPWVDSKIESVLFLSAGQEWESNFIYSYEEMGAAAVDSR